MQSYKRILLIISLVFIGLGASAFAEQPGPVGPNVVLTEVLFFNAPTGEKVTLTPGRYLVEQAGASEIRLTPMSGGNSYTVLAEILRHEQYELFAPFALTRPDKEKRIHVALFLPGGLQLEAIGARQHQPQAKSEPPPVRPQPPVLQDQPAKKDSPPQLAYVPPRDRQPVARVTSGGTGSEEKVLRIVPLAPDHVGLTTKEQPVLYWYLTQVLNEPVDVAFLVMGEPRPIFEVRLVPPFEPGLQVLNLSEYGVWLPSRVPYQWRVVSRGAGGDKELVGAAVVMRIPVPDQLSSDLVRAGKAELPLLYAKSGIWYDALASVSDLILASPNDILLRQQRASLLEQVGLTDLARSEREAKFVGR